MIEEKIIEEMAKTYCHNPYSCYGYDCLVSSPCTVKEVCKELYEQNYRKIPKDAVVLTREEWKEQLEPFRQQIITLTKEVTRLTQELIDKRKETAREILKEVGKTCGDYQWFKNLCKQFGVEVEE